MNYLKQWPRYSRAFQNLFGRGWRSCAGKPLVEPSIYNEAPPDIESLRNEGPAGLVSTQPRLKLSPILEAPETEIPTNPETTKIARVMTGYGDARPGTRWLFKIVAGLDLGRQYLATTEELKIGRKPENHIYLRDPKVSRFHAVVRIKGSLLTLVDLESTNGTSVNEVRIHTEKRLFPGDRIKVGETVIQVISQPC
jgi:hypothetical protein